MQNRAHLLAAAASALGMMVPLFGLIVLTMGGNGSLAGDAPLRAVGVLCTLSPFGFLVLAGINFVAIKIITSRGMQSGQQWFFILLVLSVLVGLLFSFESSFGLRDQFVTFLVFFGLSGLSLGLAWGLGWLVLSRVAK